MNNFRFQRSAKRKFTIRLTVDSTKSQILVSDVIERIASNESGNLAENPNVMRIESMDFEIVSSSASAPQTDTTKLNVLGRPAVIMASNNVGPDGSYKIPEECVLRKWVVLGQTNSNSSIVPGAWTVGIINAEGTVSGFVPIPLVDNVVSSDEIAVYVHGSFVE